MNEESEGFVSLRQNFPKKSESKMKEGVFVGAQIKHLFADHDFSRELNATETRAWKAFENIC
jgi:hypothetical protein